jgi:hypothetical protein
MSEHFLGSNRGFEILENSVQNPVAAGTAGQTNYGNDSHKQGHHGCNNGENECTHDRWRWKMTTHQDKEITPTIGNLLPTSTGLGTNQTINPRGANAYVPIAKFLSSTNLRTVLNYRQTRTIIGQAGSWSIPLPDKHRLPQK